MLQVPNPTIPGLLHKTHDERHKLVDDKLKELGVRGEPTFQSLSYFKCDALCLPERTYEAIDMSCSCVRLGA